MNKRNPTYKDYLEEDPKRPGLLTFGGKRMAILDIEGGFWTLRKQLESLVGLGLTNFTIQQAGVQAGISFAQKRREDFANEDGPTALKNCIAAYQAAGFGQFDLIEIDWAGSHFIIQGKNTFESWMMQEHAPKALVPACSYSAGVLVGFVNYLFDRKDIVCLKHTCQAMGGDVCTFELIPQSQVGSKPVFVEHQSPTLGGQFSLLDIARDLSLELELESLVGSILEELNKVVEYDGSTVLFINGEYLDVVAYRGQIKQADVANMRFHVDDPLDSLVIRSRKPVIISDTQNDTPEARAFRRSIKEVPGSLFGHIRSWMGIPLLVKDRVIGQLALEHVIPNFYQTEHAELTFAFANQAAIAIENARIYRQAKQTAILEERARISRDLHDSVSQSLYGIALGVRTALKILDQEHDDEVLKSKLERPLNYMLQLTDNSLTEMRALIFELHPEVLQEQGIVDALERLIHSFQVRNEIKIQTEFCLEPPISFGSKEVIYRITQESLNNISKHAQANLIKVSLQCEHSKVVLCVEDDGIGFDPQQGHPGHLGLRSMEERTQQIGGSFLISSEPGQGTAVCCEIPVI